MAFYYTGGGVNSFNTDDENNVFISGGISYSAIFPNTTLYSSKNSHMFYLKLDKNGNYQWVKQGVLSNHHNYYNESFSSIQYFKDSITYNDTTYYADDYTETGFLLVGVDKNYSVKWSKQFTTEYKTRFSVMGGGRDNNGNIFISGHHNKSIYYDGNIMFNYNPEFHGLQGIFLSKFDTLGNLLWSKSGGSPSMVFTEGITADTAGNVFITGFFNNEITFESTTIKSGNSNRKMFIAKYDKDGNLIWLTNAEGGGSAGTAMASDNYGNVYFGGKYGGEVSFGPHTLSGSGMLVGKIAWEAAPPVNVPKINSKEKGSLFIYPNPTHSSFTIHYQSEQTGELNFKVKTLTGAVIYEATENNITGTFQKQIDIGKNAPGIYFVELVSDRERLVRRVVVN